MKTNDTNKSVFFRGSLVVLLVATISLNASADNFLKRVLSENGIGKLAALMVDNMPQSNDSNANLILADLKWDEKQASAPTTSETPAHIAAFKFNYEEETEAPMAIEPWMFESEPHTPPVFKEEIEKPMIIEEWMYDSSIWHNNSDTQESTMPIEAWMTDDKYWR
ncbi:hypothetical protein EMN47_07625 [Prolixibacteraceae bacterium JC049]|nr:hypothetical protein [Prolixibacteraceae bacterium JC049]